VTRTPRQQECPTPVETRRPALPEGQRESSPCGATFLRCGPHSPSTPPYRLGPGCGTPPGRTRSLSPQAGDQPRWVLDVGQPSRPAAAVFVPSLAVRVGHEQRPKRRRRSGPVPTKRSRCPPARRPPGTLAVPGLPRPREGGSALPHSGRRCRSPGVVAVVPVQGGPGVSFLRLPPPMHSSLATPGRDEDPPPWALCLVAVSALVVGAGPSRADSVEVPSTLPSRPLLHILRPEMDLARRAESNQASAVRCPHAHGFHAVSCGRPSLAGFSSGMLTVSPPSPVFHCPDPAGPALVVGPRPTCPRSAVMQGSSGST